MSVSVLVLFAFQYRAAWYLLPLIAAFAAFAAWSTLRASRSAGRACGGADGEGCLARRTLWIVTRGTIRDPCRDSPGEGMRFRGNRPAFLLNPADQFYAADLALPKVHYVYIDPGGQTDHGAMKFGHMGITVTGDQFRKLDALRPVYKQRMREWGLDSDEALATVILVRDASEASAWSGVRLQSDSPDPTRRPVPGWCGSGGDEPLGSRYGVSERGAFGQFGGDGGGVGATGAVCVRSVHAVCRELVEASAGAQQQVDGAAFEVTAFDEDIAHAHGEEPSAARFMSSGLPMVQPVNDSASGTLGVSRRARGRRASIKASRASAAMSGAPCLEIITGSTTRGQSGRLAATARMIEALPSAPVLAAAGGISSSTARSCATMRSGAMHSTRSTRSVFWTVSKVITASP